MREQDEARVQSPTPTSLVAVALVAGILIGFLLVNRIYAGGDQGPTVTKERFAVMASTLYAEGEPLAVIDDYLQALGRTDHASYLLQVADRYEKSDNQLRQREAVDLQRLGQALQRGYAQNEEPITARTPVGGAGSTAAGSATQTAALPPSYGIVKSPQGDGVRLRVDSNTKSPAIALLANGTRVEILNVVEGEEIDRGEKRWYKVRNGQAVGYVYFPLISPPD